MLNEISKGSDKDLFHGVRVLDSSVALVETLEAMGKAVVFVVVVRARHGQRLFPPLVHTLAWNLTILFIQHGLRPHGVIALRIGPARNNFEL